MDTSTMEMSELVAYHNQLASTLGRGEQSSFKSIAAARAAILKLETLKGNGATMSDVQADPATQIGADVPPTEGATETVATNPAPTAEQIAAFMAAQAAAGQSPMNSVNRRGPTQGVGAFCKELILQGKTNAEILAAVAVKFNGTAKTSNSCIAFYRNALKGGAASRPRSGKVDITALEAKAAKLQETIAQAKAAAIAKAAAEKAAAEQAAAQLALMQAAMAQQQATAQATGQAESQPSA